ncbi:MAG: zinc-dependent metalloprotease [Myxococcales bacterium]|nr:zinc-dependent metalloprotease [Myxococcales bacterium]
MKTMIKRFSWLIIGAAPAMMATSCAQEMGEITRVQNNLTKKVDLRGEWYYRTTVVDAPYTSLEFFPGNQSMLQRGVFEIQEKTLYFYRTYELMIGGEIQGAASDIDTPLYEVDDSGNVVMGADGKPKQQTYTRRVGNELVTFQKFVYRGVPLAAFAIDSHFDVQRGYNALTGEETNVVDEDTSTRNWYEREYMRVQWGSNNFTPVDFPGAAGVSSSGTIPSELLDSEFDREEAPVYVRDGEGALEYFDYQWKATYGAALGYQEGYGTFPACLYYPWFLGQITECISERVTHRDAFMRAAPSDYVAKDYDEKDLKKFGYFRNERSQYDAVYGNTYSGASRRIQRHRIFEDYVVAKGAACEVSGQSAQSTCGTGEICDLLDADGKGFCVAADPDDRLDYAKMTGKPVVYYLSQAFPRDLVPSSLRLADNWSKPLDDVIAVRGAQKPAAAMFTLCENNLAEATAAMAAMGKDINNAADVTAAQGAKLLASIDPAVCQSMDSAKRFGDLRYSLIASINKPISYGLYGYGPSSADPLSGENISANAYMYTPAMKQGANMAMLAIELQTGIRSFWETVYANQVRERSEKTRLGAAQGGLPKYTLASAKQVARGMLSPEVAARLQTYGVERSDQRYAENRMSILAKKAPGIAAQFATDDVKMMLKDPSLADPSKDTLESLAKRLGPQAWGHHNANLGKKLEKERVKSTHACRFEDHFADNAILGLAREYGGAMNQAVCDAVKANGNELFDFQAFEELSGTCNAAGAESADGLLRCEEVTIDDKGTKGLYWANPCTVGKLKAQLANAIVDLEQTNPYNLDLDYYPPDPVYTDTKHDIVNSAQRLIADAIEAKRNEIIQVLYERIYQGVAEHEVGHTLGLRHNFEASTDAINFGEKYWNLKGEFGTDGHFHAYDMFAGETLQQAASNLRQMQTASVMDYSAKFNDRFEGVGYYDRAAIRYGYGGLVEVFNKAPESAQFDQYMADPSAKDPSNTPLVPDFASTHLEKVFKRVHYTRIPDLFMAEGDKAKALAALHDRSYVPVSQLAASGKTEVPYRFCSDELSYRIPTCATRDSGVDSFEIVRNALADYEQYWPIWGYWHNSVLFQPDAYYNRIASQFAAIKMQLQWWGLEYQRFNRDGWWEARFNQPWHEDENGGLNGALAVVDSLNTLAAAFGRPEPGNHGYTSAKDTFEPLPSFDSALYSNFKVITPLNCEARQMYPEYDYDAYLPVPTRAGAIYDRLVAYEVLADPTGMFIANDTTPDVQKYMLSYFTLYPTELMNLYAGMIANKTDLWGWYMVTDDSGTPDHCVRRNLVGPNAKNIDELRGSLGAGEKAWAFNPEPQYTFPTTRFRVPMLAALYGLSLFNDNFNNSFVDVTRVFVDGHKDGITPTVDAEVTSFTDPLSGKTYTATASKFNDKVFHPAPFMIEQMKSELAKYATLDDLQKVYNYSEYQFTLDKLELLRGMNTVYDSAEN